jgi:hypothetical protein
MPFTITAARRSTEVLPLAQVSTFPGVTSWLVMAIVPLVTSQPEMTKANMANAVTAQPVFHENKRDDMVIAPNINTGASPRIPDSDKPRIPKLKIKTVRVPAFIEFGTGRIVMSNNVK